MRKFAFVILAACLAVPAMASPEIGSEAPKPEKPKKEKRICRHVDVTESRLGATVCKTAAEWEQEAMDDSDKLSRRR